MHVMWDSIITWYPDNQALDSGASRQRERSKTRKATPLNQRLFHGTINPKLVRNPQQFLSQLLPHHLSILLRTDTKCSSIIPLLRQPKCSSGVDPRHHHVKTGTQSLNIWCYIRAKWECFDGTDRPAVGVVLGLIVMHGSIEGWKCGRRLKIKLLDWLGRARCGRDGHSPPLFSQPLSLQIGICLTWLGSRLGAPKSAHNINFFFPF